MDASCILPPCVAGPGPKRGSTFRAAGHLGVSAGQCASCNNKAFLPIMDSHRVGSGHDFRGPGRVGS